MASDNDIADGIDKLMTVFKEDGVWSRPASTSYIHNGTMCIADALFIIFPGGYVPLRGAIGEYLSSHIEGDHFCKTATYFWENQQGRTQDDVRALLNRAFEGIMK